MLKFLCNSNSLITKYFNVGYDSNSNWISDKFYVQYLHVQSIHYSNFTREPYFQSNNIPVAPWPKRKISRWSSGSATSFRGRRVRRRLVSVWGPAYSNYHSKVFSVMDAREIVRKGTDKSWTFDRVYNPVEDNRSDSPLASIFPLQLNTDCQGGLCRHSWSDDWGHRQRVQLHCVRLRSDQQRWGFGSSCLDSDHFIPR